MKNTAIRDKNTASHYIVSVTIYSVCNKAQFRSTHSSETQMIGKIISPNMEDRYPGSKSGFNNP